MTAIRAALMTPIKKAAGGYKTTTATTKKTHFNVALGRKKRHTALKRCATFLLGAEKHHGLGRPVVKAQQPRPSIGQRLYFFSTPCCAGRGFLFGGPCRDTRKGVPVP
jgi:hypothetical protein